MTALARGVSLVATLLSVGLREAVAYRSELVIWLLSTNTPLIMLVLWNAVAADAPIGAYDQRAFTAYFLVTLVVRLLTGAWVVWQINMEAKSGQLAMRLLRPVHPFLAYASENVSMWPLRLGLCTPIMALTAYLVGADGFSHDPVQWLITPVSVFGAWALAFSIMLVIGALALWWHSTLSLFDVYFGLYFVLSGYIIPLELFPQSAQPILSALPFKYVLSFPVENILGHIDRATSLTYLGRQWLFAAAFLSLALVLWKRGLRRYDAFGG